MRNKRIVTNKKSNVILEYSILIFIVIGMLVGVHYFVKRNIQARIKAESDRYLGHGQGLEWGSSLAFISSSTTFDRSEDIGGSVQSRAVSSTSQTSLQAPVPSIKGWSVMEHKGSALHVQDAPSAAPVPDYPDLEYKGWDDQGWPLH